MGQTCKWLDEVQQKQRAKEREVSQTAECGSLRVETVEQWQREQSALLQEVNARSRSVELLERTLRRRISKCTCTATAPPTATATATANATASASARSSTSSLAPAATCAPVATNGTSTSTSATPPRNASSPSQSLSPLPLTTPTSAGGLLLMAIPPIPEESEPPESATSLMGLGGSGSGRRERTSTSPVREAAAGEGTQAAEKAQGTDARLMALTEQLNQLLSRWTAVWDLSHKLKRRLDLYHSHLSEVRPRPNVLFSLSQTV